MSNTVLTIGASGKFASLLIPELAKRDVTVRGLIRRENDEQKVKKLGAKETVIGDISDIDSIVNAMKDVSSLFYIAPAFIPNETQIGQKVVEAALKSKIKRIVFSSVIHPVISELINHSAKAPVEEAILDSGIEFTFLHPTVFFQNYNANWNDILKTSVLAEPWSDQTKFSRVDYRDVAEVAAMALTDNKLVYGTFELCAPGQLNRLEVAELLSKVLNKHISSKRLELSLEVLSNDPMQVMFKHYDHQGLLGNPLILESILGREPRTLKAYFEELAEKNQ